MIDYDGWRARRLAEVTAPDGWLAVVGQQLLEEGANAVPEVGTVTLLRGATAATVGDLRLDPEAIVPFGARTLQLVTRAGRAALRIRDPEAPARRDFRGIPAFPIDSGWRRPARLVPDPRTIETVYTIGASAPAESPGSVEFEGGRLLVLRVGARLLAVFGDRTNGRETYGGGRFLWIDEPVAWVDFNEAENPACVFTEHAACPLPAPENRLALRVEAGEQYPHP